MHRRTFRDGSKPGSFEQPPKRALMSPSNLVLQSFYLHLHLQPVRYPQQKTPTQLCFAPFFSLMPNRLFANMEFGVMGKTSPIQQGQEHESGIVEPGVVSLS